MDPASIVDALGYPAAGLGILIESAGVPFPGETLLLAAAAWSAARHHSIVLVILFGFLGATAGSNIGYYLGYRGGRPFVERFGSLFRIRADLHRALRTLLRPPRRQSHPRQPLHPRAAHVGLHARRHVENAGLALRGLQRARRPGWWVTVIGLAGYLLGDNLALIGAILRALGFGGLVLVALIAITLVVMRQRAAKR